jgi:Domain of unknown function (DUF1877)
VAYTAHLVRVPAAQTQGLPEDAGAAGAALERGRSTPGAALDLDEAWAPLHFVLTDELPIPRDEALRRGLEVSDSPLETAILGGQPTPYGTTYGVVRYLSPPTVQRVSRALDALSAEDVQARYDPDWLREMRVPMVWADTVAEERAWLGAHYQRLRAFYRQAAGAGDAVLSYLL